MAFPFAPAHESPLPDSDFIDFPPKEVIVERLRAVDEAPRLSELYDTIGDRLASKTYERSASAFILIEMLYDFEETVGSDMSYLLPRSIFTLTGDRDLALSALGAFNEIKDAIILQTTPSPEKTATIELPLLPAPPAPPVEPPPSETDLMMHKLQTAQKALFDMGLTTRVSIDLVMRRPSRDRVSRTLQDIASLRAAMRRFEELLSSAELQVLEAAGVLWEGSRPIVEDDEAGEDDD
ncbi:MAG TPA: hypothetical protein VGV61_04985 [Thermoanaerobaculia bacterium]|jgi:hypothetical protein|nr:hypothetical protein [Thermoanaerobaculia bacterium]